MVELLADGNLTQEINISRLEETHNSEIKKIGYTDLDKFAQLLVQLAESIITENEEQLR